jgi:glycosyltransferase involved in cell wall biosynthesis
MISIIVTAYNNTLYIKEALDSIVESCGDLEYEVLVGVDNCSKTLEYLNSIKNSLSKKIKILFFTEKTGTYVIRNTLASESKYEHLLFFDSDDVMRKILVNNVLENLKTYDYVRYGYQVFKGVLNLPLGGELLLNQKIYHNGTFGVLKKVFIDFNGFEPWVCASDGEFYWRVLANNKKIKTLDIVGLFYRRHETNLTSNPSTGMNSPLRKQYHKKKEEKQKNNQIQPLDKLHISEFIELNKNTIDEIKKYYQVTHIKYDENQHTKKLSVIIPTFNNVSFLPECFDSILKSIKDLDCEILVGIDGCNETSNYLKNKQFDKRFKFYFFEKNVGPYVIKNTLVTKSSSNKILFFDSDDIMLEDMVPEALHVLSSNKFYKPMYVDFTNKNDVKVTSLTKSNKYGEGVFAIDRETFLSFNGFEGWRCAADSDLMGRLYSKNISFSFGKMVSFLRRIHPDSLTVKPETNYSSKMRAHYYGLSKKKRPNDICDVLSTSECKPITITYVKDPIQEKFEERKKDVDIVLGSILNLKNKKPETSVDYGKINEIISKKGVYNVNSSIKPVRQNTPKDRNELMNLKKGNVTEQMNKMFPGKPNRRGDSPNIFSNTKKNR